MDFILSDRWFDFNYKYLEFGIFGFLGIWSGILNYLKWTIQLRFSFNAAIIGVVGIISLYGFNIVNYVELWTDDLIL